MASRPRQPLTAYRIADIRYPIFDGTGAMLHGARWNSPGRRVIYCAGTYAGALLEVLVHTSGRVPRHQAYVRIDIPADVSVLDAEDVAEWDHADMDASRAYGDRWYDEARSAVLTVPSIVTRVERNVLIHPFHPDFRRIVVSGAEPVMWDARLWAR